MRRRSGVKKSDGTGHWGTGGSKTSPRVDANLTSRKPEEDRSESCPVPPGVQPGFKKKPAEPVKPRMKNESSFGAVFFNNGEVENFSGGKTGGVRVERSRVGNSPKKKNSRRGKRNRRKKRNRETR